MSPPLDSNMLALTLLVSIGMQGLFFSIAYTCSFDKVTDIAGSMNFVLIAWLTFWIGGHYHTRQIVVLCLVTVWGVRLGSFLLYRVLMRGKDDRFDEMRSKFWSFAGFWTYQMLWAWIVSLPVTFLQAAVVDRDIGALDIIGWSLWAIGFVFESLADQTKHNHYANPETRGTFLSTNVWRYSRHPNYFGEIACWTGIFLTSASVYSRNTNAAYVSVLSPVFSAFLLLFVSGIPLGEERYDLKFGADPAYRKYKAETSPLIPMPPALYARIPNLMRLLCCCEFPMYSKVDLDTVAQRKSVSTDRSNGAVGDLEEQQQLSYHQSSQ